MTGYGADSHIDERNRIVSTNTEHEQGVTRGVTRVEFEKELTATLPTMTRAAYFMLGDVKDAEELVQAAASKAYSFASENGSISGRLLLLESLVGLMRTIYGDELNETAEYSRSDLEVETVADLMDPDCDDDFTQVLRERADGHVVREAFLALPHRLRLAAVFTLVDGISYDELATITSWSREGVCSRVQEGRKLLRVALFDRLCDKGTAVQGS